MGQQFPKYPNQVSDGDEASYAPTKNDRSLLGTERGTDYTRRLETDTDRNLYVHVAADSSSTSGLTVGVLATDSETTLTSSTLATVVTYTAPSAKKVSKISVSGDAYAKYTLVLNSSIIDTKRVSDYHYDFVFEDPFNLATNDILDVKVEHFFTGETANFESTIYGG